MPQQKTARRRRPVTSAGPDSRPKQVSTIGRLILDALAEEQMSQSDLARTLAGPVASRSRVESVRRLIQKWIRGDNEPSLGYAVRLAVACERDADFFVSALTNRPAAALSEPKAVDSDQEALEFARQAVELFSEATDEPDLAGPLTRHEITNWFPRFNPDQVLLDRVDELVPGQYVRATKRAQLSDWELKYWYRDTQIIPGVLLAEALAQTAAICLLALGKNRGRVVLCAAFNNMKFKRIVQNNEELTLESAIVRQSGPIAQADVVATVGDEVAVRGRLTLAVH